MRLSDPVSSTGRERREKEGKGRGGRGKEGKGHASLPAHFPNVTHAFRNKLCSLNSSSLLGHDVQILENWIFFSSVSVQPLENLLF